VPHSNPLKIICLCGRYSLCHTPEEINTFFLRAGLRTPKEYREFLNYDVWEGRRKGRGGYFFNVDV
jgi:hypothetical protein